MVEEDEYPPPSITARIWIATYAQAMTYWQHGWPFGHVETVSSARVAVDLDIGTLWQGLYEGIADAGRCDIVCVPQEHQQRQ